MKPIIAKLILIANLFAAGAHAAVLDAAPGGFTIQHEIQITADRATTWDAAINNIGQWWSSDHTVAGDASRLSIEARPMGCFCEALAGDDGVVHLVVTSVSTHVMLRMTGGLGPLGLMGVDGNMTWEFFEETTGTRVKFTYAVGGYRAGGLDTIADAVDFVIGEALALLKAYVERD